MSRAIGMLETWGLLAAIEGLDSALKAANVAVRSFKYVSGGLVAWVVEGDTGSVRVAVAAGKAAASRLGKVASDHVIPRPADGVAKMLTPPERPGGRKGGTGIHKRDFPAGKCARKGQACGADAAAATGQEYAAVEQATAAAEQDGAAAEQGDAAVDQAAVAVEQDGVAAEQGDMAVEQATAAAEQDGAAAEQGDAAVDQAAVAVEQDGAAAEQGDAAVEQTDTLAVEQDIAPTGQADVAGDTADVAAYTRERLEKTGIYEVRAIARRMAGISLSGAEIRDARKSALIDAILEAQEEARE